MTGEEIFRALDEYVSGKQSWAFCVDVSTDDRVALAGKSAHFIVQHHMVATRKLSLELNGIE